jgi:hypothetical protein
MERGVRRQNDCVENPNFQAKQFAKPTKIANFNQVMRENIT